MYHVNSGHLKYESYNRRILTPRSKQPLERIFHFYHPSLGYVTSSLAHSTYNIYKTNTFESAPHSVSRLATILSAVGRSSYIYVKCKIVSSHTWYSFLHLLRLSRPHISLSSLPYISIPGRSKCSRDLEKGTKEGENGFCGLLGPAR